MRFFKGHGGGQRPRKQSESRGKIVCLTEGENRPHLTRRRRQNTLGDFDFTELWVAAGSDGSTCFSEFGVPFRGNSSVGRAPPCQGGGRRFESGFPLFAANTGEARVGFRRGLPFLYPAPWPSGKAEDCKSSIVGSIPTGASLLLAADEAVQKKQESQEGKRGDSEKGSLPYIRRNFLPLLRFGRGAWILRFRVHEYVGPLG